jgi:hypothetical protein
MKMKTPVRIPMLCCIVLVGVSLLPPNLKSQNQHKQGGLHAKEVYTGTAVAVGGQFGGASRPFTMEITGYTPDEEVQQDFQVLRTQGTR